jgi:hypothetical protein
VAIVVENKSHLKSCHALTTAGKVHAAAFGQGDQKGPSGFARVHVQLCLSRRVTPCLTMWGSRSSRESGAVMLNRSRATAAYLSLYTMIACATEWTWRKSNSSNSTWQRKQQKQKQKSKSTSRAKTKAATSGDAATCTSQECCEVAFWTRVRGESMVFRGCVLDQFIQRAVLRKFYPYHRRHTPNVTAGRCFVWDHTPPYRWIALCPSEDSQYRPL